MSQATLNLPVTGTLSGLALVNYVNDALARLSSLSSGNTDPSTLVGGVQPYSLWVDTSATPPALKIRNNTNTAWANIGTINGSNFVPDLSNVDITNALGFTPATSQDVDQKISAESQARTTAISTEATARANADALKADKTGGNASGTWPINISGNAANGGVTSVNGQVGAVTVTINSTNYANSAGSVPATACVYNSGQYEQYIGQANVRFTSAWAVPSYDVPTNYFQTGLRTVDQGNGCCGREIAYYVHSYSARSKS